MRSHKLSLFVRRDVVVFALSVRSHSQVLKLGMANKLDAPNKLGMANYTARKRKCKLAGMDRGKKSTACGFANRAEHGAFVVGCWLLIAGYGCGFADSTMVKALPLHSRQISDVAIWDLISVICRLLATATSISRLSFSLAAI